MSRNSNARQRGVTLPEMLTVSTMLVLFMTTGVAVIAPMLDAPNQLQAKVDTLQSAASGFYRLQRDARTSDIGGDFACTTTGTITCTQTATSLTSTPAVAILTAFSGSTFEFDTGTGSPTAGKPTWQGVVVYWVATSSSGQSNLYRAVENLASSIQAPSLPTAAQVQTAVSTAVSSTSPSIDMANVSQLQIDFNSTSKILGIEVVSTGSEGGRTNETSYESDTYARN